MKIEKLILKNFFSVNLAMNAKEIEIDFTKGNNKVCLFIGPNGSGKTSILSLLNPFADLGNLDVRNNSKLILDNENGYKEIHIRKDSDLYIIKHFYTPHKDKSHSVKSYISLNDTELNINGNVTSFKEIVKEELQIETDYLKLIRLGNNVSSIISLSTTERKNFMSKIMDDIGIYLEYYKSINTKIRQLDDLMSHTVDKMKHLNITDKNSKKQEIEELQNLVNETEAQYISENQKLAVYQNNILQIPDVENISENVSKTTRKYNKMVESKEKHTITMTAEELQAEILKLEKENEVYDVEIISNEKMITNTLDLLDRQEEQKHFLEIQLRQEKEKEKELTRMEDNLKSTRFRLRESEDILGDFKPTCTKNEFDTFFLFLKNSQQILNRTYEFGKLPVERVVNLLKENKNVMNYINSHLIDLDEKNNNTDSLFLARLSTKLLFSEPNEPIVINCKEECNAKTVFRQIQNLLIDSNISDKNENASFYHDMEFVYQNLLSILPKFSFYKDTITALPDDLKDSFLLKNIYDNISSLSYIYDEKKMNDYASLLLEYENYVTMNAQYENDYSNYKRFKDLTEKTSVEDEYESLSLSIEESREKISNLKKRILEIQEIKKENNFTLERDQFDLEIVEKFDDIKELYETYNTNFEIYKDSMKHIQECNITIEKLKIQIDHLKNDLKEAEYDLHQYITLNKEIKKMNHIYDEMILVKKAYSTKDGIPLRLIGGYLDNVEDITNELLDIAYDGKIYLDKFEISPTEFAIPFYNRGFRIPDVKLSSQGELSFLSIALSFALSTKALRKYNIMLLDEIDGPLDTSNREKFIQILENQIDRIDSEQNFLITHNAMFSSYPVDIVDFSFQNENEDYPLANFIPINRLS